MVGARLAAGVATATLVAAVAFPASADSVCSNNNAGCSNSSGTGGGSSPITVTLPTWTVGSHDLIVIAVAESSTKTITTPTGYTAGPTDSVTSGGSTLIYRTFFYKVATSTDSGATVTLTPSASTRWAVESTYAVNYDFDTSAYSDSNSSTSTQPYADVTASANDVLVTSMGIASSSSQTTNCGWDGSSPLTGCQNDLPSGGSYDSNWTNNWTNLHGSNAYSNKLSAANVSEAMFFGPAVSAGTTNIGHSSVSSSANNAYSNLTIALKPHV
jgi:hypothetical protein